MAKKRYPAAAVAFLNDDILIGERYDGKLIAALSSLSLRYWQENANTAYQAACALAEVEKPSNDTGLLRDTSALVKLLREVNKL